MTAATWIIVDVETDGPCPGLFSMVSLGAVILDRRLDRTFYGVFAPLPDAGWNAEALAISGTTREQHLAYPKPQFAMAEFWDWIATNGFGQPIFVSDNPAFDWQFVNYYFHLFIGSNPFGFSARRIGDIYAGMMKDAKASWKHLRKTTHSHFPVDDAKGNAEAILAMVDMGLRIPGIE